MSEINIAIIGCGFVADYYMTTATSRANVRIVAGHDIEPAHAARFERHWGIPAQADKEAFFAGLAGQDVDVILNLTNPESHFEVSRDCLERGYSVYSEKPLAMTYEEMLQLKALASEKKLDLAGAPCNHLSSALSNVRTALEQGNVGQPYLVYAEMDDGFTARAPYKTWINPSGAPWPYLDEFEIGCTLEHAGYYLTWLIALFGSVTQVTSFAALCYPGKPVPPGATEAPDFSVACLTFESGLVARLTCSVVVPKDRRLKIYAAEGVVTADDSWTYDSPVAFRRWIRLRRRFTLSPWDKKVRVSREEGDILKTGSAQMDFARGPIEMVQARRDGRASPLPLDFCIHFNEVSLAIHNSQHRNGVYEVQSRCTSLAPVEVSTRPEDRRLSFWDRRVLPVMSALADKL